MLIGNSKSFAIEVYHDRASNTPRQIFGRMCIHAGGAVLGDIHEPACMLDVTEGHLSELLGKLSLLENATLDSLNDQQAFDFLNEVLYLDNGAQTLQEIQRNAKQYSRFIFVTNGGESFDRTKSFIAKSGELLRLLFTDQTDTFHAVYLSQIEFSASINDFLSWIAQERLNR